jgi:hypothetical protein
VLRQNLVDEGLVADAAPLGLFAELPEDTGVEPDCD